MTNKIKAGDVIIAVSDRGQALHIAIVSGYKAIDYVPFLAWKTNKHNGSWTGWHESLDGGAGWYPDKVKPHPDPDSIWAEYTAWKLMQ